MFEVYASNHINVEDDDVALGPDALHLAAQRAVAGAVVDLFPLDKGVLRYLLSKLILREEEVIDSVALLTTRLTRSGRDRELELREGLQKTLYDCGLARAARGREYNEFALLILA